MSTPSGDASRSARLLSNAEALYHNLATELARGLRALKAGKDDPAGKARAETLRAHRKALQTILELELQLVGKPQITRGGHEIDLEDARAEIYRRLDRLANAI